MGSEDNAENRRQCRRRLGEKGYVTMCDLRCEAPRRDRAIFTLREWLLRLDSNQ